MSVGFEFDFDDWAALAQRDPDEFERRRDLAVDACCERLGGRSRPTLSGICWRIELERKRSASPMQLCLKLSSLMWQRYSAMSAWIDQSNALIRQSQALANESAAGMRQLEKDIARPMLVVVPSGRETLPSKDISKINVVTD